MRTFISVFFIGLIAFAAYTLGAKAGRGRYREIRAAATALWDDPRVKKARKKAARKTDKQLKKIGMWR